MSDTPDSGFDVLRLTTRAEEESEIIKRRDAFFKSILVGLGFKEDWLERVPAEVVERDIGREDAMTFYPTDDKLHYLILEDEALAVVFDRRNDGNFHEVTFWSRRPSEASMCFIEDMVSIQNSQAGDS